MPRKKPNRKLPPIDIRKKEEKGLFGRTKLVPRPKREQRKVKTELMKQYPDRYFVDDLRDRNSVKQEDCPDDIEAFVALWDD